MGKIGKSAVPVFILMVLWLFVLPAQAKYNGGSGDPCDPYQINDPCQMNAIGTDPCDWDKHFILTADIDLSAYTGEQFNIIAPDANNVESGFQGTKFTGSFDGDGHTITNFAYSATKREDYIGLFGYVGDGGEIKNLGMTNVNVSGGDCSWCLGGLVGYNEEGSISNCYATGSISGGNYSGRLGGLVGYNYFGSISNCYATGNVSGGEDSYELGGLMARNSGGSISNCYATGNVSGGFGSEHLGGLVGCNNGSIINCYATGSISGEDRSGSLGGLVGQNVNGSVSNCYATGSVSGFDRLGGLVGQSSSGSISNSFWDMETSDMPISAGGTALTTAQMHDVNTFLDVGWDFVGETANGTEDIWWMPSGWYPNLAWQPLVTFPDITGMSQTEAQNIIIAAGLTLGRIDGLYSSTIPMGIIIDQSPPPGIIVGEHSSVNMIVSLDPSPYAGGSGSENDAIQIATADQLELLANTPSDYDLHFILTADIDLLGRTYATALNAPEMYFDGSFDGNDHRIINLTIRGDGNYLGLFGKIGPGSVIKNLILENVAITGGDDSDSLGGLVGYNHYGSISNCYASGSISGGGDNSDNIGGLVGKNYYGNISNCYATGSVSGYRCLGGLVGMNYYGGSISNCYATGNVSSDIDGSYHLGGLVGGNSGGSISNCHATGNVSSGDSRLGGLVGWNYYGSISDCYATGNVSSGDSSWSLGGLVGVSSYGGSISNCYATGNVSSGDNSYRLGGLVGDDYIASGSYSSSFWNSDANPTLTGIGNKTDPPDVMARTTAEMQTQSTFTDEGWDFVGEAVNGMEDIWDICEGTNYPKLSWQFLASDFTCPDGVDLIDFAVLADTWSLSSGQAGYNDLCDMVDDDVIDLADLAIFAENWMKGKM